MPSLFYAFLLVVGTLSPTICQAQRTCPDMATRYSELNELNTLSTDSLRILRGIQLLGQWQKCQATTDSVYAKLVHVLGRCYWYTGQLIEGEKYTREAIRVNSRRQSLTRPLNLANSYTNLGQILGLKGQYRQAIDSYNKSVSAARRNSSRFFVAAIALEKKATLLYELGDYEQAALSARQGYEFAKSVSDTSLMVRNLVQESQSLSKENENEQAKLVIQQALILARRMPNFSDLANTLSLAATVSRSLGDFTSAIKYHEQAFILNKRSGNQYGCWQTQTNLAYVYQTSLHQHKKALYYFSQAEQFATTPIQVAVVKAFQASSVLEIGQSAQALKMVRESLGLFAIRYPASPLDSNAVRSVGQKEYLLSVLKIEGNILYQLARQTRQVSYWQQARRTYQVADYVIDLMRWEHQGQQSKLYWRETTHLLYENAIEVCSNLADAPGAFYFIEKSRAVLLTDKLNELGARRQLSPVLAQQEQFLSNNVESLRAGLLQQQVGAPIYRQIQTQLLLAQEKRDAFVRQMEKTNPLYYRYRYDNAIRPLAEVSQWLFKRNQSLVSYFVGDSALYVLGVSGKGSRLIRQPVTAYTTSLHTWLALLNDPVALNSKLPEFVQTGARLYHLLLEPLHLPTGRVMVSPDGFFLPFEALSRSATVPAQPDYLVNSYAFSYVYSVNRLLSDPAPTATDGSFAGFAPVTFAHSQNQHSLPTLSGSEESLKRVGSHFFMPTVLTGSVATRAQFRAVAPSASVVQLFTHADADTLQREPVLYFADSLLHLSELQTGPAFQTQLLVLSACRTGVGSHQKGEGVFSLARGFAALGVPSMLTTLWSVENQPTYALTELFYQQLSEGVPKDIALQQTKQDWLQRASRSEQLPHIWAGMILIGDSEPVQKQPLPVASLWIGVSGTILGLLTLVLYNRWKRKINGKWGLLPV